MAYQLGLIAMLFFTVSISVAQTIQFNISGNYTGSPNSYYWVQGWSPATYEAISFSATVTAGTGAASPLIGQSFLAFCVNLVYPDPTNSTVYDFWRTVSSYPPSGLSDIRGSF